MVVTTVLGECTANLRAVPPLSPFLSFFCQCLGAEKHHELMQLVLLFPTEDTFYRLLWLTEETGKYTKINKVRQVKMFI